MADRQKRGEERAAGPEGKKKKEEEVESINVCQLFRFALSMIIIKYQGKLASYPRKSSKKMPSEAIARVSAPWDQQSLVIRMLCYSSSD